MTAASSLLLRHVASAVTSAWRLLRRWAVVAVLPVLLQQGGAAAWQQGPLEVAGYQCTWAAAVDESLRSPPARVCLGSNCTHTRPSSPARR